MNIDLITRYVRIVLCIGACIGFRLAAEEASQSAPLSGDVTLSQCIAHALTNSPRLEAFAWDVRAAEAAQLQAKARPNPYLSLEVEDVRWRGGPGTTTTSGSIDRTPGSLSIDATGGQGNVTATGTRPMYVGAIGRAHEDGAHSGLAESDFTLRLSQVVELGGKRAKRIALAARGREVAAWDYERARADVCAEVAHAFVGVLAAQRRVELAKELTHLAEEAQRTVNARVDAGKVSPIEAEKARIPVSQAKNEEDAANAGLQSARAQLAGVCGDTSAGFGMAQGNLEEIVQAPPLEQVIERVGKNPDIARWAAEIDARDAAIVSERARRKPDVTLTFGVRTTPLQSRQSRDWSLNTDGVFSANRSQIEPDRDFDTRLVFDVGLPLPIFDRNKGNIRQAEAMASKAHAEERDVAVRVRADVTKAYHDVSSAYATVQRTKSEILPAATEAFDKTQIGYREGKFGYADVIDSERTLFDAQRGYLDALQTYHAANIELERLTGDSIPESSPEAPAELSPSSGAKHD